MSDQSPNASGVILVVDDSAMVRGIIRRTLQMCGVDAARIREAGDGAQGLEALDALDAPPALVLSDLQMPNVDGYAFIERLRQRDGMAGVPVAVITAEPNMSRLVKLIADHDVAGCIRKPFTPEALGELVNKLTNAASKEKDAA